MVGDSVVCVDRIIASAACFDSGNGGGDGSGDGLVRREQEERSSGSKKRENDVKFNGESLKKTKKKGEGLTECRICQEEGEESEMEAPCACNGTLKFAHRKCIQRWCNKKGDITCEICNQVYAPNYSAPPTRTGSDVIAIDIRQGWGARIDLHDSHFLAIAAAEQELLNAQYEEYAAAHNSGIGCCRSVALIGCWNGPRCIRLLQLIPSTCWFSSTMLFDSTFMLHPTKQAETTGLRFFWGPFVRVHEKRGKFLAAQRPSFLVFDTFPELIY